MMEVEKEHADSLTNHLNFSFCVQHVVQLNHPSPSFDTVAPVSTGTDEANSSALSLAWPPHKTFLRHINEFILSVENKVF